MRVYTGAMSATHTLHDRPLPGDEARWGELLDALDLDELTESFMDRVVTVPGYDGLNVNTPADLNRVAGLAAPGSA